MLKLLSPEDKKKPQRILCCKVQTRYTTLIFQSQLNDSTVLD